MMGPRSPLLLPGILSGDHGNPHWNITGRNIAERYFICDWPGSGPRRPPGSRWRSHGAAPADDKGAQAAKAAGDKGAQADRAAGDKGAKAAGDGDLIGYRRTFFSLDGSHTLRTRTTPSMIGEGERPLPRNAAR